MRLLLKFVIKSVFILLKYKQIGMYQIDMAMYEQMGFNKQEVKKAYEYSQQNRIDIFDALQYLQKKQNQSPDKVHSKTSKLPQKRADGSLLRSFKTINLNNYEILFSKRSSRMNMQGKKVDLRQQFSPVGLLNVYNCCYLNSLLQCYFLSSKLINYIFEAEPLNSLDNLQSKTNKVKIKRIKNEYNLLLTLKDIFGKMCLTSKKYIDPTEVLKNLVDSLGQKIQFGEEKDLFETNILIIQRLNECLLYTKRYFRSQEEGGQDQEKYDQLLTSSSNALSPSKSVVNKSKIRQRDNIKRLFYGQKVQYTDQIRKDQQVEQIVSDFLGIIINPAHQNLYKALYEEFHYEVQLEFPQEKRKQKTKKHTYIRQVPEYLYFYINRTGYNTQQRQAMKNQQKLSFDFVIYLDRFMEKYKEEASANTLLVIQLWKKKNQLKKKINVFEIFAKKLSQCRQLATQIDGWAQKLPLQQQITQAKVKIQEQLKSVEKQLQKIQSRKEKYHLMYIFSHRGDAVSGHYWGYGRNAQSWYKFDINTKQMKQEQILLDLYKCGGTPYALVYTKQSLLPKISYNYFNDFSIVKEQSLLDMADHKGNQKQINSYINLVPLGFKKVILSQNMQIHQQNTKRRNLQITLKTVKEYSTRFSWLEIQVAEILKKFDNRFKILPSYDNFAIYLWTSSQIDLAKYNIFAVSLKSASNMTTKQLIEDEALLNLIQKQFRKKMKRNKALKHFCIDYEPKEGQKYALLHKNYLLQKQAFLVLLRMFDYIEQLEKTQNSDQPFSQQLSLKLNKLLKRIALLKKIGQNNNSYIKHILSELATLFILQLVILKVKLQISGPELNILVSDMFKRQIQILCCGKQSLQVSDGEINEKEYYESSKRRLTEDQLWSLQEVGKGPNRQILQNRMPIVGERLKMEMEIFRKVQKQNKLSIINPKSGKIQDYHQQSQNLHQYAQLI